MHSLDSVLPCCACAAWSCTLLHLAGCDTNSALVATISDQLTKWGLFNIRASFDGTFFFRSITPPIRLLMNNEKLLRPIGNNPHISILSII